EAGYCLVASAVDGDMRLISVVMGTDSEAARARETQKLMTYGFRFFETYKAYSEGDALTNVRVWMGTENELNLGPAEDLVLTRSDARYCLVASAVYGDMRLISVVMGTDSEAARARETQKLMTYGFRFFETYKAYSEGDALTNVRVWMGTENELNLGPAEDLVLT